MNNPQIPLTYNNQSIDQQEEIQHAFILQVYGWMTFGLIVTAMAALMTLSIDGLVQAIVKTDPTGVA